MTNQQVQVIAHRGAKGDAPENTLAAFRLAMEQGCDVIELDIHLSQDGELVVIHDATVDRTTDMTGTVYDMTSARLKQLDAGKWFNKKFAGERIPLLEEVFDLVPPEILINVEIKHSYHRQIEPALCKLIKKKNRVNHVVVSSFDHKSLLYLKRLEPKVKIGLLYDCNPVRHSALAENFGASVYSLHPDFRRIAGEDVREAAVHGLRVFAYTINQEDQMIAAIHQGVSGIITDFPGRLRKMMNTMYR